MIPAEIIEKAAKANFIQDTPWSDEDLWETRSDEYKRVMRESMTRILAPVYADIQAEAVLEAVRVAGNTDPRDHPFTGHDEMAEWLTRYASRLTGSTT